MNMYTCMFNGTEATAEEILTSVVWQEVNSSTDEG